MLEQRVLEYIREHRQEALDLLLRLAVLPAFSGREEGRAAFCKDWLQAQGAQGVYIDEALNVVFPINCEGDPTNVKNVFARTVTKRTSSGVHYVNS